MKKFRDYLEQNEKEITNTIDIVYFDMDGVLADLKGKIEEVKEKINIDVPKKFFEVFKREEYFKTLNVLMKPNDEIFKFLKDRNISIQVLGSIGSEKNQILKTHKTEWLKNKGFEFDKINFVPGKRHKKEYAEKNKNTLLIDDTPENVAAFEAAGGKAILHKNNKNTLEKLKNILLAKK